MKQRVLPWLLTVLLVLATGCGQSAAEAGFSQADFYLTVGGKQYRCGDDMQAIIDDLGEEYDYSEGITCAYDDVDKTFAYDMAEFYTTPTADGDVVREIYTEDAAVTTSRNITVGAAKQEVLDAYGTDAEDTGYMLIYRLPGEGDAGAGSLCFELEEEKVIAVFITTEAI